MAKSSGVMPLQDISVKIVDPAAADRGDGICEVIAAKPTFDGSVE